MLSKYCGDEQISVRRIRHFLQLQLTSLVIYEAIQHIVLQRFAKLGSTTFQIFGQLLQYLPLRCYKVLLKNYVDEKSFVARNRHLLQVLLTF